MGLSRRFLRLVVDNGTPAAKSLHCIDMRRHRLFNRLPALPLNGNTSESEGPQEDTLSAGNPKYKMRAIRLPAQSMNLETSPTNFQCYMDCFPLAGDKLLCTDQSGLTTLFSADTRQVAPLPSIHLPKFVTLPIFVPSADESDGGSIYIMECRPNHEPGDIQLSHQFEAFVYRRPTLTSFTKSWQHEFLPRPPFICDPKYYMHISRTPTITSYAVVGDGSKVCVSVDVAGTYCLDTVTHSWTQVGDWTLPFVGKVEYVPELKLWFGFCAKDLQLVAADLSTMDMNTQPQLVHTWKEFEAPQKWTEVRYPQLVNLGSGMFCVTRFFLQAYPKMSSFFDSDPDEECYFTVLTGTEVVPCVHDSNGTANATCSNVNDNNRKLELKMIKHNSRCHRSYGSDGTIRLVF